MSRGRPPLCAPQSCVLGSRACPSTRPQFCFDGVCQTQHPGGRVGGVLQVCPTALQGFIASIFHAHLSSCVTWGSVSCWLFCAAWGFLPPPFPLCPLCPVSMLFPPGALRPWPCLLCACSLSLLPLSPSACVPSPSLSFRSSAAVGLVCPPLLSPRSSPFPLVSASSPPCPRPPLSARSVVPA